MEKLKVGWVGAGFVGQAAHLERFIKFPEAKVVALAELREKLRAKVSTSYDIPDTYKDHNELLRHNDCDAVVVIVNRRNTFQIAKDVLESGRHLLTEKPMALMKSEAQELVNIAESKGVVYAVGFMRRYDDGVRQAKKVIHDFIQSGELGSIVSIRIFVEAGNDYCGISQRIITDEPRLMPPADNIAPSWLQKEWHAEYEKFVNVCSHDINLLRFLISENISVSAVDLRPQGFSYVLLDCGSFPGILEWGYRPNDANSWSEGVEIRFEKGQVALYLPPAFVRNVSSKVVIRKDSSSDSKAASKTTLYGDYSWAFENSDHVFVNSVIQGLEPDNSGADCLQDFDIIDEIWRVISAKQ